MQGRASKIPRGGSEIYPRGWGNCFSPGWFPWEGLALLKKNVCCDIQDWHPRGIPTQGCFPSASHSRLFSGDSSPQSPPFARAQGKWLQMKNLCFGLLKNVVLSPVSFVSLQHMEILQPFTIGCYQLWTADPDSGIPCWGSQSEVQDVLFSRRSSHSCAILP